MRPPPTLRERLRYAMDNVFARGAVALTFWLGAFTILLVLAVACLDWWTGLAPGDPSLVRLTWMALLRTLDPGTMGGDDGDWRFLASMLFITLAGIVILSTLIGIINNAIVERIERLRKGRSRVLEGNHTVILGWTKEIFTILEELVITNIHKHNPCVVILAGRDKIQMEDEIAERIPDCRNTRIICRTGNPLEFQDLAIASLDTARSVIVLSPGDDSPDSEVIKTLLAIVHDPERRAEPYHIVAVVREKANFEVARLVGRDEVELLLEDDIISRIVAQTCRQSGLSVVYEEILDYAGDEFYFVKDPGTYGRTFEEVMFRLDDCSLVGLRRQGELILNPSSDTKLAAGDELLCLAADQSSVRLGNDDRTTIDASLIVEAEATTTGPEKTLVLGANRRTSMVVEQLDRYVAPGSLVKVVAIDTSPVECPNLVNTSLVLESGDVTSRKTLESLDLYSYDRVVLMCDGSVTPQQADSRVLMTLLHLRDLGSRSGRRLTIVSEMMDPNNCRLAAVARADDFIVGSRLVSFLLTQISESRGLVEVFSNLFDAEGQEIYLKPAGDYLKLDTPANYATLLEAARRRGEIAIGYRRSAEADKADHNFGVVLNPGRSERFSLSAEDRVVV
ncbi:MAG: NAD-binding protein, partial [Candidatus Eremiobacteraeota bacterium]|nr:NAD-binding protein [Candidatus Eremiobacteraeota bacterium]